MKAVLPTADEVQVVVRAIEGGAFDDAAKDWCCGRKSRAVKRLVPAAGRLVGHPLDWRGGDAEGLVVADPEGLTDRAPAFAVRVHRLARTARAVLIYAGDVMAIEPDDT